MQRLLLLLKYFPFITFLNPRYFSHAFVRFEHISVHIPVHPSQLLFAKV